MVTLHHPSKLVSFLKEGINAELGEGRRGQQPLPLEPAGEESVLVHLEDIRPAAVQLVYVEQIRWNGQGGALRPGTLEVDSALTNFFQLRGVQTHQVLVQEWIAAHDGVKPALAELAHVRGRGKDGNNVYLIFLGKEEAFQKCHGGHADLGTFLEDLGGTPIVIGLPEEAMVRKFYELFLLGDDIPQPEKDIVRALPLLEVGEQGFSNRAQNFLGRDRLHGSAAILILS